MSDEESTPSPWLHMVRAGTHTFDECEAPDTEGQIRNHRNKIEPWLAALFQAEHLNLLVGNGLTTAIAHQLKTPAVNVDISACKLSCTYSAAVCAAATRSAKANGRGKPNIEDIIRSVRDLVQGLQVVGLSQDCDDDFVRKARSLYHEWSQLLESILQSFLLEILETEAGILLGIKGTNQMARRAQRLLCSFLLSFASRAVTRERLHVFTTNYDRTIEFGADLLGLRVIDRFVGELEPVFRASRLGIDMHYNPPGIRGEPRYLEGVIRLTKLHGSIDWRQVEVAGQSNRIVRTALPFGARSGHSEIPVGRTDGLMIYPNPAKDMETLEYPYAELFRDFAAAVCQPNAVLVTYGYGFGDDHINRILRDMLTIPSTHLAILSYDDAKGRIPKFCDRIGSSEQISLLIGPHFGDLSVLVDHYLPKPAIDQTTWKMVELINRRAVREPAENSNDSEPRMGAEAP